jgi:hypothetical protein
LVSAIMFSSKTWRGDLENLEVDWRILKWLPKESDVKMWNGPKCASSRSM